MTPQDFAALSRDEKIAWAFKTIAVSIGESRFKQAIEEVFDVVNAEAFDRGYAIAKQAKEPR